MTRAKARILLVEDDEHVRDGVAVSLRMEGYEVHELGDGRRFTDVVASVGPDLVILDVRLGVGPDGYMLGRALRQSSDAALLYLTAADSVTERLEGFGAGADDYLVKPFVLRELLARVQALLRRAGRLAPAVYTVGDLKVDLDAGKAMRGDTVLDLRAKEFELLCTLARHAGQVLSKTKLLDQVWGIDAYDTNLVEVQVSSLRRKLEAHGPRLLHTERGYGYVLRA